MGKCLIVLTNITPLEKSESFVKNEIPFLSNAFEKVLVLALQKTENELIDNIYPTNVDVFEINSTNEKNEKLKSMILGAFNLLNPNEIVKKELKTVGINIKKAVFLSYFENRCKTKFSQCLNILNKYDFSIYDEVVIYSFWFFLTCRVGVEIKNYLNSKNVKNSFISRAHGHDLYNEVNSLNYLPEREFLLGELDFLYPCSKTGEEYIKSKYERFSDKIKFKYLGTFDKGLSSYSKTFHIVTCSHCLPVKRLDKLVNALSNLKNSGIEIYWTHIGDGVLFDELKSLAKEKLGFMNFEFLGRMDNSQVMSYYSNHPVNLFINVSESEGLPVSIMEASSFGIPILATDVGGTNEIVKDGFNGKIISKDFSDAEFCNALLEIYNLDENSYQKLRTNARNYWVDNFNAENNYNEFANLINNLEPIVK